LEAVHVVAVEVFAELSEEVTQEARVGDHGDALLGTLVEPLEELDGTHTAMLVRFPLVRVEYVLVVHDLGEVEVGEFGRYLRYGPTSVADVVTPPLAAFLSHEESGRRDLHAGGALGGALGGVNETEERRLARIAGRAEDVECGLASARERGHDD
jgi:hypothetical protein